MAEIDPDVDSHLDDIAGIKSSLPAAGSSRKSQAKISSSKKERNTWEELAHIRLIEICEESETVRLVLQKTNASQSEKKSVYEFIQKKMVKSLYDFSTNQIGKKLNGWKTDLRNKLGMVLSEDDDFLTERDRELMKIFDMRVDSVSFKPKHLMDSTASPALSLMDGSDSETNTSILTPQDDEYLGASFADGSPKQGFDAKIASLERTPGEAEIQVKVEKGSDTEESDATGELSKKRKSKTPGESSVKKQKKGFSGSCPPVKKAKASVEDIATRMMDSQAALADKLINSQKESQQSALEAAREENRLAREHDTAMMMQILGALRSQQPQIPPPMFYPMPYQGGPGPSHGHGPQFPSPGGANSTGLFNRR